MATTQKRRILSTPEFTASASENFLDAGKIMLIAARLWSATEPSFVVGDPKAKAESFEDGGRTLRQVAPFRFYAIRDDHEADCDCGCNGMSIVTFMLPEDY
jgi:hypothetical protein